MTLGETIKLLRTEQGLTQPELAEKARIEQSYLSKLENESGFINGISESEEEWRQRLLNNRGRFDKVYVLTTRHRGEEFFEEVPGGRRYYYLIDSRPVDNRWNAFLEICGTLLGVASAMLAALTLRRL
jgi:transcriptional regulator with XRE-family HTH domain